MRILFVSNFFPPHELGGYGQWCGEMALLLQKRGHEICVLTSTHRVAAAQSSSELSTEIMVERTLHLEADIYYYDPSHFFFKRSGKEAHNVNELKRVVEKFVPQKVVIWGMWNLSLNIPKLLEEMMPNQVSYYIGSYWPIDVDPHTAYWNTPTNRPWLNIVKWLLRQIALTSLKKKGYPPSLSFRRVMCCSDYVRKKLTQHGVLHNQAAVIHGGIDISHFSSAGKEQTNFKHDKQMLRLVFVGRLIRDKGVHTAIEALGILKEQGGSENVDLTIIGSGHPDYEQYLKDLSLGLEVDDAVHFMGRVDRQKLPTILPEFDIFLFTSVWEEPFGIVILEAMLSGLIVVGSNVGGAIEIMKDHENAMLFEPENATQLASIIQELQNEPQLLQKLRENGKNQVSECFSLTKMAENIEAFLVNNAP